MAKNANNKVNRWGLELGTYNITFEWISGACNKASDCLSCLVELPQDKPVPINMLSATNTDGPVFHTRSQTLQHFSLDTSTFCKQISKCLSNGKAPQHKTELFLHVRGLLYKHVTDSNKKFLAFGIPKAWKNTVLVEAHNKLGHQGSTHNYCLIKCQYYWKGMKKDIRRYIANCTHCHREKAKVRAYPLQMTEILDRSFDKIAIDLVTECKTSNSGNNHILTIIDYLTG